MWTLIAIHHVVSLSQLHGHHHHPNLGSLFCTVNRSGVTSCVRSIFR